jgi:Tol biopolymer transport system component/serine/threonine protein kinase
MEYIQLNNYKIIELIDQGKFATVYKAEKLDIHKIVTIKCIKPEYRNRSDICLQFKEQYITQAKLRHSHVVKIEDLREEQGFLFIAMEYFQYGNLHKWITEQRTSSFRQIAIIVEDIADGLDYIHANGQVHGNIKPSNILLYPDLTHENLLRAKITDIIHPISNNIINTQSEDLIGFTAEYISPEQAGNEKITPLSDQYSLGIITYEMLCLIPPFTGISGVDIYIDHQKTQPTPLTQLNNQITSEMQAVVLQALEKLPEKRFNSCGEFAKKIRLAVAVTEIEQLNTFLSIAKEKISQGEFEEARKYLQNANIIEPDNLERKKLYELLISEEKHIADYQQANILLQESKEIANTIASKSPDYEDKSKFLCTFVPPPLSLWGNIINYWKPAGYFAAFFILIITILIVSFSILIKYSPNQFTQSTIIAYDRTSTPTSTPTFTSTYTATPTVSYTPTFTKTPSATPTLTGGGDGRIAFFSRIIGSGNYLIVKYFSNNITSIYPIVGADCELSPDGYSCLFSSWEYGSLSIYKTSLLNRQVIQLSSEGSHADQDPVWSPDGKQIAFCSLQGGNQEIYLMESDGSNKINISNNISSDIEPVWSPDGRYIAFRSDRNNDHAQYFIIEVDTTNVSRLSTRSDDSEVETHLAWAPDGKKVAFFSGAPIKQIHIFNIDDSSEILIPNSIPLYFAYSNQFENYLEWSPDSNSILFPSHENGNWEIFTYDIINDSIANLTSNYASEDLDAKWSPDGNKILYVSFRNGNYGINIVDSDGNNHERYVYDLSEKFNPVFSPDGKMIAYTSNNDRNTYTYVMDINGTTPTKISDYPAIKDSLIWINQ